VADMSKKHHILIADAINESVDAFFDNEAVQNKVDAGRTPSDPSGRERNLTVLGKMLKRQLAQSFAEKLRYTHDSFDSKAFVRSVTGEV